MSNCMKSVCVGNSLFNVHASVAKELDALRAEVARLNEIIEGGKALYRNVCDKLDTAENAVASEHRRACQHYEAEIVALKLQLRDKTQFCAGCEELAREVSNLKLECTSWMAGAECDKETIAALKAELARYKGPLTEEQVLSAGAMLDEGNPCIIRVDAAIRKVRGEG